MQTLHTNINIEQRELPLGLRFGGCYGQLVGADEKHAKGK